MKLQSLIFKTPIILLQIIYSMRLNMKLKCKKGTFYPFMRGVVGDECINLGDFCRFGKGAILAAHKLHNGHKFTPEITIGNNCDFGDYTHITCINKIVIGNNLLTGRYVLISDNSHGKADLENMVKNPNERILYSNGPVIIGNNVWIGDKVSILSNVKIGDGAIIGANSVVTKDIPPYSVAAGIPAKIIRQFNRCETY